MELKFEIRLDYKSYAFYNEIAWSLKRPIEDILSDTLYKYADVVMKEANESGKDGRL